MTQRRPTEQISARIGSLRALVAEFDAQSPRERRSKQRFLDELERLSDPFDRYADPVHVTGSAIVVGPRGVLLHLHKRFRRWIQPGGHLESGESPEDAAQRETEEETGLVVAHPDTGACLVHLDAHPAGAHFHLDLRYLLIGGAEDPAPPPGESPEVRWFSLKEALERTDEALVDGLRRVTRLCADQEI